MRTMLGAMAASMVAAVASPAPAADIYSSRVSQTYTYEREFRRAPRVTVIERDEPEMVVVERRVIRRPIVVEREVVIEPQVYHAPVYAYGYPWRHRKSYYRDY